MKKKNKGFSLIELIGVIILISLATLIIVPNIVKVMDKNNKNIFEESVKGLIRAVGDNYALSLDNFPKEGLYISEITFEAENLDNFVSGIIYDDNGTFRVANVSDGKYCATGKRNSLVITEDCDESKYTVFKINLSNFKNWKSGHYNMYSGKYERSSSRICLNDYVTTKGDTTFVYKTNDAKYQLLVRQLDKDKKFLGSTNLVNNHSVKLKPETYYLAFSLYKPSNESIKYDDYVELFNNGFILSFTKL